MPSLKDIRKRIGSVKNTQQITKAMKMVEPSFLLYFLTVFLTENVSNVGPKMEPK